MLAEDRRRHHPTQWGIIVALVVQTLMLAYSYGKLAATVADYGQRLTRIEQVIDSKFER